MEARLSTFTVTVKNTPIKTMNETTATNWMVFDLVPHIKYKFKPSTREQNLPIQPGKIGSKVFVFFQFSRLLIVSTNSWPKIKILLRVIFYLQDNEILFDLICFRMMINMKKYKWNNWNGFFQSWFYCSCVFTNNIFLY